MIKREDFSTCQLNAFDLLFSDNNVFVTGQAGTGKSYLIRKYLEMSPSVPILASTGRAALLIGGMTFHSFFRMIPGLTKNELFARNLTNPSYRARMRRSFCIIIDEISMLSGETLAIAEELARRARNVDLPWGGMRIIVVGDFAQLPPVAKGNEKIDWAFSHDIWKTSDFKSAPLKTLMRTQDPEFIDVLNDLRVGSITDNVKNFFNKKIVDRSKSSDLICTRIYARKKRVEQYNISQLFKLPTPTVNIPTLYLGKEEGIARLRSKDNGIAETLTLKLGALVMIKVNNLGAGYANGTLAFVEKIEENELLLRHATENYVICLPKHTYEWKTGDNVTIATATQFPVILGWSITIHGSQGSTLDSVVTDLSDLFEFGQAYTAVSRLKTGNGLYIHAWSEDSIIASKKVMNFYKEIGL